MRPPGTSSTYAIVARSISMQLKTLERRVCSRTRTDALNGGSGALYEAYAASGEIAIPLSSPRYGSGKARAIASTRSELPLDHFASPGRRRTSASAWLVAPVDLLIPLAKHFLIPKARHSETQ